MSEQERREGRRIRGPLTIEDTTRVMFGESGKAEVLAVPGTGMTNHLLVYSGDGETLESLTLLPGQTAPVGRESSANTILFKGDTVSRSQGEFSSSTTGQFVYKDVGSTNGSFEGGIPFSAGEVPPGEWRQTLLSLDIPLSLGSGRYTIKRIGKGYQLLDASSKRVLREFTAAELVTLGADAGPNTVQIAGDGILPEHHVGLVCVGNVGFIRAHPDARGVMWGEAAGDDRKRNAPFHRRRVEPPQVRLVTEVSPVHPQTAGVAMVEAPAHRYIKGLAREITTKGGLTGIVVAVGHGDPLEDSLQDFAPSLLLDTLNRYSKILPLQTTPEQVKALLRSVWGATSSNIALARTALYRRPNRSVEAATAFCLADGSVAFGATGDILVRVIDDQGMRKNILPDHYDSRLLLGVPGTGAKDLRFVHYQPRARDIALLVQSRGGAGEVLSRDDRNAFWGNAARDLSTGSLSPQEVAREYVTRVSEVTRARSPKSSDDIIVALMKL